MTAIDPRRPRICPDCFAPFKPERDRCWLCGWRIGDPIRQDQVEKTFRSGRVDEAEHPLDSHLNWTFSLSTMFLWTTLVAVLAALTTMAPGLGIALIIVSFPAALRTIVVVRRRRATTGEPLTTSEKIFIFMNSLQLIV